MLSSHLVGRSSSGSPFSASSPGLIILAVEFYQAGHPQALCPSLSCTPPSPQPLDEMPGLCCHSACVNPMRTPANNTAKAEFPLWGKGIGSIS